MGRCPLYWHLGMLQKACLPCSHCLPTPLGLSQKVNSGREGLPRRKINRALPGSWEAHPNKPTAPREQDTWDVGHQSHHQILCLHRRQVVPGWGQGFTRRLLSLHSSTCCSPTPSFEAAINIDSGKSMCFRGPGSIAVTRTRAKSSTCQLQHC